VARNMVRVITEVRVWTRREYILEDVVDCEEESLRLDGMSSGGWGGGAEGKIEEGEDTVDCGRGVVQAAVGFVLAVY